MIRVNYTQEGNPISDWEVNKFVSELIKFNKKHEMKNMINISTENVVHAFRFAVVNKDIALDDITFYHDGEKLNLTKYGTCDPWPKDYLCFQDNLMRAMVKAQCKIRKEENK